MSALDIKARSATTTPPPGVRQTAEIAKLIDESKCIGCKACQVACMEWNDLRDEVGSCVGSYDNPPDLSEQSWTVMKFREYEDEKGKLDFLKDESGNVVKSKLNETLLQQVAGAAGGFYVLIGPIHSPDASQICACNKNQLCDDLAPPFEPLFCLSLL